MAHVEFGLDTFGALTEDDNGELITHAQTVRDVVADGVLADSVGLDFFGVGEHHRPDFAVSSPEMVLAAIAGRTERIRLGSAVTVLSSDDPVRVFERFATLDAVSNGRAEIVAGRGSFIESFPLFGYDLSDYEVLFEEKLELLAKLLRDQPVTWQGTTRSALSNQQVFPSTEKPIPAWVGVGGDRVGGAHSEVRVQPLPRDHRRAARALRPLHRPLPPCPGRIRHRAPADRRPFARSRRRVG